MNVMVEVAGVATLFAGGFYLFLEGLTMLEKFWRKSKRDRRFDEKSEELEGHRSNEKFLTMIDSASAQIDKQKQVADVKIDLFAPNPNFKICPNCETANDAKREICEVCDTHLDAKPEDVSLPDVYMKMKSKIRTTEIIFNEIETLSKKNVGAMLIAKVEPQFPSHISELLSNTIRPPHNID